MARRNEYLCKRSWRRFGVEQISDIGNRVPAVYVLYRGPSVVYVGHAADLKSRLLFHRRRLVFTHFKVTAMPDKFCRMVLERKLLVRLRPVNNRHMPASWSGAAWWAYRYDGAVN